MSCMLLLFALCRPTPAQAPTTILHPIDSLRYARIAGGLFLLGCSETDADCAPDEFPHRGVTVTKPFMIGTTEVTVGAYKRFARATRHPLPADPFAGTSGDAGWKDNLMPITNVAWTDASAFCTWAGGKLPTEAQWEYAARGKLPVARYGPLESVAWTADNSGRQPLNSDSLFGRGGPRAVTAAVTENGGAPHRVALKAPNGYGLYDMLGNVQEWVQDWFASDSYAREPLIDPVGPVSGAVRAMRGGHWASNSRSVRVSKRVYASPTAATPTTGFRCTLPVK